jgi:lysyl oxidase-like protein 2/3/4
MEVFATFDVMDSKGVKVAEGHKASFCLEDNQCMPGVKPFYACANFGDQGISVNCSDIYRHNIDCQWVDISELNPGIYTFKVSSDKIYQKINFLLFFSYLFLPVISAVDTVSLTL